MSFELLSHNRATGVKLWHAYDDMTDTTLIKHTQDAEPILDWAKARCNDDDQAWRGRDNDFWMAATVPIGVQMEWITKHGVDLHNPDHIDGVKRLLNGEYKHLKTAPITI